jgi:hypothetical protein
MKKIYFLLLVSASFSFLVSAQTTVTYTLDANSEDATVDNYTPGNNYPNEIEYASRAWTISSTPVTWRSFFKFDLSCIPPNATVVSSTLSLFYANTNNFGNAMHSSLSSSNESLLQRVTSAWTENTVTWNNQPTATATDQVILAQSTSGTQDYPNLDVTAIVQQMVSNPNMNFGFLLRLTNETAYAQMFFASGDNPATGKRPSLTITYTVPVTDCITLTLDSLGEDATIDDYSPANNWPDQIEYTSRGWTISSIPVTWRSLFKFNIPCDLSNAVVQNAYLSLFWADTNALGNGQQSSLTSSNESVLQRVTSAWTEHTVTWNNQPTATTTDQVILPQSTSGTQDYPNINVTSMVQQMVSNPNMNFGFLLHLTNETAYAQMLFASGDNPHTSKHPTLQICYSIPTSINSISAQSELAVFPNPAIDELSIVGYPLAGKGEINIYNALGEKVLVQPLTPNSKQQTISIRQLPSGIYFVKVFSGERMFMKKFVKE